MSGNESTSESSLTLTESLSFRIAQSAIRIPFYDPSLSYQQNYDLGPFGAFGAEPSADDVAALQLPESEWATVAGLRLRRPVGIPSGPLLNAKFVTAAFNW